MTLQEVLRQNKIRVRQQRLTQIKHERKIRICKNIITGVIVISLIVISVIVSNHYDRKAISECSKEHDLNYCIVGLS